MRRCLQPAAARSPEGVQKACRSRQPFRPVRFSALPRLLASSADESAMARSGPSCRDSGNSQCRQDQHDSARSMDGLACSRRDTMLALAAAAMAIGGVARPPVAVAGGIGRYIKRKALDPLDTYVPLVLEARQQLQRVGDTMSADPTLARDLLRSGPFSGLRDNIRAIGEYAVAAATAGSSSSNSSSSSSSKSSDAGALVQGFFSEVEGLDRLLFVAARDKKPVPQNEAAEKLKATITALDSLLATVPADVLEKSQQIVQRIQGGGSGQQDGTPSSSADVEELQQLLSGST